MEEEGGFDPGNVIGDEHPFAYPDVPPNRLRSFTCLDPDIICGEPECPESIVEIRYKIKAIFLKHLRFCSTAF